MDILEKRKTNEKRNPHFVLSIHFSPGSYTCRDKWERTPVHFDVSSTVHHSIELFHVPTLMHNSLFINNMYVTLLSSTCFEH